MIWPEDRRAQLDLRIAHARGERMDEVYRGPSSEVKTNAEGKLVVSLGGTKRSWE